MASQRCRIVDRGSWLCLNMMATVMVVVFFNVFFAAMISLITIRSPEWSKAQREYISHDVLHIARVAE